ncbi:argininosuccinate synthase, chloroplastic-like isoform X2 [Henckelia pumila]|uniref:argininosuccinate synthase, chloroplastic-like isoform X2 n=1 Tax=Henckelia pumila TaxID=405737 RepID=UPI003C6DFB73
MASEQEVVVKSIEFNGDAVVQARADSGLTCSKDDCSAMGNQFGKPAFLTYVFSPQASVMHSKESRRSSVDVSGSDKGPITPSSVLGNQLPPHSSHIERKDEPEIYDERRAIWSPDEDVVLVRSWATISTGAVTGNDQKDRALWRRIGDYYNKHRPAGTVLRHWKQLKSHYYRFWPMVNEFSATYNNLYTHCQTRWSDENVLESALNMWKANNNNKDFKYMHVWRVFREYEKHAPQSVSHHSSKKVRTSKSGWHTSTSNLDAPIDVDDCELLTRPIGQKTAKRKGESKSRGIDDVVFDSKWKKMEELQTQRIEMQKQEIAMKDYEIFMKDTSGMTEDQLNFHLKFCESIKKRYAAVRAVLASDKEAMLASGMDGKSLPKKLNKVVLAYSGGLDTSVIVLWLRENYGCEVVCFTADVGQGIQELEGLEKKAKASGACQLVVKDLKEEFVRDFIFPCLRAGAIYERKYLLGTSMARPVIAKAMVDVAKEVGADAVSHGCTGKGNDQVRFELTFFALNPELSVVAPWREWEIKGREDAIEYAVKHNVPIPVTKESIYSRDRNLWHLSHEGDILEDPANEPMEDMYMITVDPEEAPDQPEYVKIGIIEGLPVSINAQDLSPASLLSELNDIGGKHGIGRVDMVENRLVGMKSRGVYETPGGTILFTAVRELESLTLDRETMQTKDFLALKYAELVYAGRWFDPLRESIDAFMKEITKTTIGSVTLKLYKGSVCVTGRESPNSLYRQDISSFESGEIYNQADAPGFIRLYGLPMRVRAMLDKNL